MINNRMRRQVISEAITRLRDNAEGETLLRDDLPRVGNYYNQNIETYTNIPEMNRLLRTNQFGDGRLINRINNDSQSQQTIQNYLQNIRTENQDIGDLEKKNMLSSYIRTNFEDDYDTVRRVGEVIQSPAQAPAEVVDDLGHSLVQVYGALGNENSEQAFSWYYQQIPFPPLQALRDLQASQDNVLNVTQQARQRVIDATAYREGRIAEIIENLNSELNKGMFAKMFDHLNNSGIVEVLSDNKVAIGSGVLVAFTATGTYLYKNPELVELIFNRYIKPVVISNLSQQPTRSNIGVYKSVTDIQRQMLLDSKEEETVRGLMGRLLDKLYISARNYLFGK